MQTREIRIRNRLGLHARASVKIVKLASRFRCRVSLDVEGRRANARNILAVMMLAAGKGAKVTLEIEGPDETDAMDAIVALIDGYFGEGQ